MPFDNYLVVINLSGYQLTEVCHAIAAGGGWPVSGLKFKITNGLPYQIVINDTPLDLEQQYSVAISDYLANGGDHLDMLRGLPQINTNTLLRDAFLAYFRQIQDNGEALQLNNEMRISYE
jgi:2',3'-cyclic-nucleotide 2'-phosphodiesterase (5'-nucleotidase family)